jgi:hypothetical protein
MLIFIPKECLLDRNNDELNNQNKWTGPVLFTAIEKLRRWPSKKFGETCYCPRCPRQFAKDYFTHIYYYHMLPPNLSITGMFVVGCWGH